MGSASDYLQEQFNKKQKQIAASGRVAGLTGKSSYSNTATNPLAYATSRYETWRANDKIALNNISRTSSSSSSSSTTSSSGTTSRRRLTSSSSTSTSSTANTSRSTTSTTANTSTSNIGTTSSGGTNSSNRTISSNNTTAVAGTSTGISTPTDYPSSNTVGVSSNMDTDVSGGETGIDYSSATETAVEPSIETQAENQPVAGSEEIPAPPEQPSGQYIYAPDEGGQLWGGNGFVSDTLIGGAGKDIFIGGKEQGSDTFLNVSSTDEVRLTDVTLNDISKISKNTDTITISLNNGNVLTIQSSESSSGALVLDDSTWHFTHST